MVIKYSFFVLKKLYNIIFIFSMYYDPMFDLNSPVVLNIFYSVRDLISPLSCYSTQTIN